MKLTMQLAKNLKQGPHAQRSGCDDPVLRFKVPYLVSTIYKEHVDGWYARQTLTTEAKQAWETCRDWLRQLEKGVLHRLFACDKRLETHWWDVQVKALVSRRPTSRRMSLPLEEEIDLCIQALQPHLIVWLMELVNEKNIEMQMFPKHLLQRGFVALRDLTDEEFARQAQRSYDLYPQLMDNAITKHAFLQTYFPPQLSHWPGLRLCVPFFFDLATLQPAPSTMLSRQGKYIVLHSYLDTSYTKTSLLDAKTCCLEELAIQSEPFAHSIGLQVTCENQQLLLRALKALDRIHPRSFRPNNPDSPYKLATKTLMPHVRTDGGQSGGDTIKLPEHAFDCCEVGFSFNYMKPRAMGEGEESLQWEKEEDFYEVKLTTTAEEETHHFFHLSPYTGLGLRLRHTLLSLAEQADLKGQGVCVVVPDGLSMETTENIMLTAIGWLQGLGLTDVKLLSEGVCHAMALGSTAVISQKEGSTLWASLHDGAFVSQMIGVTVKSHDHVIQDQWNDQYRGSPMKVKLLENIRDYIFEQPEIKEAMEGLVENRFRGRTLIIEAIKSQLPRVLTKLESDFAKELTETDFTLRFSNTAPVVLRFTKTMYYDWLRQCFDEWTQKAWWTELKEELDRCKGIVVSGGIFECCKTSAVKVFGSLLGTLAKTCTKKNRLNVLHGACLAIYAEKKCKHLVLHNDKDHRLPILNTTS